ncbi:hypothetical protein MSG28_007499 [Choristoneura fumiferana]|uniref:Uncharacterized protein n=1 Tax=Choristoneura fumiferana TaxID=7141 RepID=A0ACC0JXJ4_CHOFU|nr:hypothetical protein MSG28_007499 [Choristoneura fumiferana]
MPKKNLVHAWKENPQVEVGSRSVPQHEPAGVIEAQIKCVECSVPELLRITLLVLRLLSAAPARLRRVGSGWRLAVPPSRLENVRFLFAIVLDPALYTIVVHGYVFMICTINQLWWGVTIAEISYTITALNSQIRQLLHPSSENNPFITITQINWCVYHMLSVVIIVEPCHWAQDQMEHTHDLLIRLARQTGQRHGRINPTNQFPPPLFPILGMHLPIELKSSQVVPPSSLRSASAPMAIPPTKPTIPGYTSHRRKVGYNNAFRMLIGLPRWCSASAMFAESRTDGFAAILRKKAASLLSRIRSSPNSILKMIADHVSLLHLKSFLNFLKIQLSDPDLVPMGPNCKHS